jgi:LPXTG-motif cell wall-anchored protein
MRRVTRNGLIALAAASGAMAVAGPAFADAAADGAGAGSPGLISGNTVQLPAHVPVNVCGNTFNVVGLLNPAAGNTCTGESGADKPARTDGGASGDGGATANGGGQDSPGVLSGNDVRFPVHLPVNVNGNGVNVVGVGNAAVGNDAANTPGDRPLTPDRPEHPVQPTPRPTSLPKADPPPRTAPQQHLTGTLAHTGSDATVPTVLGSAALLLVGAAVYRRFREHRRPCPGTPAAADTAVSNTVPESP